MHNANNDQVSFDFFLLSQPRGEGGAPAHICWFFSRIWIPHGRLALGKTQNKVILFKNILKKEHMQSLSTVAVFDIWGQRRRIHTKLNENDMQRTLNFNKMHFEAWSFSPTISLFSTAGTLVVVTVPSIRPTKLQHKAPKVHYVLQLPPPPSAAYAIKIWKLFCIWYNKDRFYADILWSLISKENAECSNISFL